eukprot:1739243-Rhodomonas_salina.2
MQLRVFDFAKCATTTSLPSALAAAASISRPSASTLQQHTLCQPHATHTNVAPTDTANTSSNVSLPQPFDPFDPAPQLPTCQHHARSQSRTSHNFELKTKIRDITHLRREKKKGGMQNLAPTSRQLAPSHAAPAACGHGPAPLARAAERHLPSTPTHVT